MMRMLNWSSRFNIFCFLEHGGPPAREQAFDCALAAGIEAACTCTTDNSYESLRSFHEKHPGWLFGHVAYPETFRGGQSLPARIGFEPAFFFSPSIVVVLKGNDLSIESVSEDAGLIFQQICHTPAASPELDITVKNIRSDLSRDEYLQIVGELKKHIARGDCYEINFCQEFFSEEAKIDPLTAYHHLRRQSPNPFSAFYRLDNQYCLCASPERFVARRGDRVISQPIKGTAPRFPHEPEADRASAKSLSDSVKEKAENVMVVDLVRNDLSRIATRGSVEVTELFGIYTFPQVFQMISTVSAGIEPATHWTDILQACFPMGSMTGAPKKRVMELIAQYEQRPRGLFSGTIGYVSPNADIDFNVVIRSLFYDSTSRLVTFNAGSGITTYCEPEAEYEECLLKAAAIKKILGATG